MAKGYDDHKARLDAVNYFGKALAKRAKSKCELCSESTSLSVFEVPPVDDEPDIEICVLICQVCQEQVEKPKRMDANHWRCLSDTMWSEYPAVQVLAYRLLNRLDEDWARDLLDQLYLEEEVEVWARQAP